MRSKKKLLYWKEVEKEDGTIGRYSVYQEGRDFLIEDDHGHSHPLSTSGNPVDVEIRIVFGSKVIRTIMPWQD